MENVLKQLAEKMHREQLVTNKKEEEILTNYVELTE